MRTILGLFISVLFLSANAHAINSRDTNGKKIDGDTVKFKYRTQGYSTCSDLSDLIYNIKEYDSSRGILISPRSAKKKEDGIYTDQVCKYKYKKGQFVDVEGKIEFKLPKNGAIFEQSFITWRRCEELRPYAERILSQGRGVFVKVSCVETGVIAEGRSTGKILGGFMRVEFANSEEKLAKLSKMQLDAGGGLVEGDARAVVQETSGAQ